MDIFLNPNIAYLLLLGGTFLGILAVFNPGTGLLEMAALLLFMMAGWQIVNLEINTWALVVLILGIIPFVLAMRKKRQMVYLGIAIAAFVIGSSFLFSGQAWWLPGVNPLLALVGSLFSGGFIWLATRKVMEADLIRPSHDLDALINQVGEARSEIYREGSVQVAGEMWTATSDTPIPPHTRIRVVRRDGFVLIVEPA